MKQIEFILTIFLLHWISFLESLPAICITCFLTMAFAAAAAVVIILANKEITKKEKAARSFFPIIAYIPSFLPVLKAFTEWNSIETLSGFNGLLFIFFIFLLAIWLIGFVLCTFVCFDAAVDPEYIKEKKHIRAGMLAALSWLPTVLLYLVL